MNGRGRSTVEVRSHCHDGNKWKRGPKKHVLCVRKRTRSSRIKNKKTIRITLETLLNEIHRKSKDSYQHDLIAVPPFGAKQIRSMSIFQNTGASVSSLYYLRYPLTCACN